MLKRLCLVLMLVGAVASIWTASAEAHPMPTSDVILDIGKSEVVGELELPLSRLALAVQHPLTPAEAVSSQRLALQAYVARHISARGMTGVPWTVTVGRATLKQISGSPALALPITMTPPRGQTVTDFRLTYDVIINQLITHRALVSVRTDFNRGILTKQDAEPVGIFDWNDRTLTVPASGGSWLRGMIACAKLGINHVLTGSDHLLFLLMLLLTAPLMAVNGRWRPRPSGRRSAIRVIHVVSAFALGHSTTLILAGLGVIHVPDRPVEVLIAASIAVSAIHAARPLVARAEVLIALGFGLVHGLSFASALSQLGLTRGALVSSLFGFNIGIEITQLLVVALTIPSLLVLAKTPWYSRFRLGVAGCGMVFAGSWMLERASITPSDPFLGITQWAVGHLLVMVAAIAILALVARTATRSDAGRDDVSPSQPGPDPEATRPLMPSVASLRLGPESFTPTTGGSA